jgi:methionyl-tRNA formyltransferase
VVEPKPPLDWQELGYTLAKGAPDVAITYSFMRLVPNSVTSLFPKGALNFHPALLPNYRGPMPFHWMAIDNAWKTAGGVTLHEMSERFDEGPIVAQAAMSDAQARAPSDFVADAVALMTRTIIPRYCEGEIQAWPQPPGNYPYARAGKLPLLAVQQDWTRGYLSSLCSVMRRRPGVVIATSGARFRLLEEAAVLGPPTGRRVVRRWQRIEFDLADGRVLYWRHTPLTKVAYVLRAIPRLFRKSHRLDMPIRLGPFETNPLPVTRPAQ